MTSVQKRSKSPELRTNKVFITIKTKHYDFSVSPSLLDRTFNYIRNQREHHKRCAYREEYKMFLDVSGIEYNEKYAFSD